MKKLRSIVVMSLLAVVMVVCLAGCGKSIEGNWKFVSAEAQGMTIDATMMKEALGLDMDLGFEFKKDGTFTGNFMGETMSGTWKANGDKYIASADGDDIECSIVDGKLHMEADGSKLIFEKK